MYSLEEIQKFYSKLPDSKLLKIAREESGTLRKEVIPLLKEEIEKRGLDSNELFEWIDLDSNILTETEKKNVIYQIRKTVCSKCKSDKHRLYGYEIEKVISFILFAQNTEYKKIFCEQCAKKEKNKSLLITFFLGWWSARGFLLTPFVLLQNLYKYYFIKDKIDNKIIQDFLKKNNGSIRANGLENRETLHYLISFYNQDFLDD